MSTKIEIDLNELEKKVSEGLTDIELADYFNCSYTFIGKTRRNLGLKANVRRVGKKILIDREKFIEEINNGRSNDELAKIFKVSPGSIKKAKERFGLQNLDQRINEPLILSHIQEEILFGSILGDAYVNPHGKNCSICIQHSKKQEDYLKYKCNYFPEEIYTISEYSRNDIRTNKTYEVINVSFQSNLSFNKFRNMFYDDEKHKHIPIDQLENYYTPLAMAIHYCDDGWNEGNSAVFATCSFSKEELFEFKKFLFNKYNLETTIFGENRLRIRTCSYDLFINLISNYIPESMKYKITKKVVS